jgi:hypothetical protein
MICLTTLVTAMNITYNDKLISEGWFGRDVEGRAHSPIFINITTRVWTCRKYDVGVWTGSSLLRIRTGGGHL